MFLWNSWVQSYAHLKIEDTSCHAGGESNFGYTSPTVTKFGFSGRQIGKLKIRLTENILKLQAFSGKELNFELVNELFLIWHEGSSVCHKDLKMYKYLSSIYVMAVQTDSFLFDKTSKLHYTYFNFERVGRLVFL